MVIVRSALMIPSWPPPQNFNGPLLCEPGLVGEQSHRVGIVSRFAFRKPFGARKRMRPSASARS